MPVDIIECLVPGVNRRTFSSWWIIEKYLVPGGY